MNITLNGTKITQDSKTLAFEKNNNVDEIVITVDTDESWSYKLDVKYPDKFNIGKDALYNIIDLGRNGDICSVILTREMLPFNGKYTMQLRGINGDKVYHSDTFEVWVKYSIEPGSTYNPVPSEFYQVEARLDNVVKSALDALSEKIANIPSGGSGLTTAEKTAMLALFKAAAYTSDVSATITKLDTLWSGSGESGGGSGGESGGGESETTYTVTNNLTNVTNSNSDTTASGFYSATLTVVDGYSMNSVVITMGGVDITDSAYGEGNILIANVTGDIVITAVAEEPQLVETISNIGGLYATIYAGADSSSKSLAATAYMTTMSTHRTESDAHLKVRVTNTTESDISTHIYCGCRNSLSLFEIRKATLFHAVEVGSGVFRAGKTVAVDYTLPAGYHICVTEHEGLKIEIIGVLDIYETVDDFEYATSANGAVAYSDEGVTSIDSKWNTCIRWATEKVSSDTPVRITIQQAFNNGDWVCIGSGDYDSEPKKLYNATQYASSGTNASVPILIDFVIPAGKYLGVTWATTYRADKL